MSTPGLTEAEVAERVRSGQTNDVPPRSGRTVAQIVRANVLTRINAILGVLFALVAITGSWKNGLFALLIVVNSAIGMVQEIRAKRTLDTLAVVGEARPCVRRAAGTERVDLRKLVVDDIVEVGPGDQLVVDGHVVEADGLQVDESLLTGENDPVEKVAGDDVLSGSFVVAGGGAYRATKVGPASYAGQLTAQARRYTLVHSELRSGVDRILRWVTWLLVPTGLLTAWVQLELVRTDGTQALLTLVGALVPMVPEGLVLLMSVAFATGVVRLGRMGALVQELPAIEGLARVDTVCVDKTGTLTETGLTVAEIRPLGAYDDVSARALLAQLAATDRHPNATIAVISAAVGAAGASVAGTHEAPWPVRVLAPFTSQTKWSGATYEAGPGRPVTLLLGAPDVLAGPGSEVAAEADRLGAQGLRVVLLATADQPVSDGSAGYSEGLGDVRPVALVSLAQRIRPDARATLDFFRAEGVQVKVLSGDNAASVAAVARAVGLGAESGSGDAGGPQGAGDPGEWRGVDARTLADGVPALADELERHRVFGRVSPRQKRAMVAALRSRGHVVAMTGDGVNDVLALKDCDVGIAMGSGAEACRAVAQIVLVRDRFAALPAVVAEGRRVIGNIERVAVLFLTKTFYSVVLALLVGLARLPFPFLPLHVTMTAWFTIGVPAFVLSLAPGAERARPDFARRVLARSAPAGLVIGVTTFATYAVLRADPRGATPTQVSTAALAVVIAVALWVLAVVSRPDVWWKWALLVGGAAAYVVLFCVPVLARFFVLDVASGWAMGVAGTASVVGVLACELARWAVHRMTRNTGGRWAVAW